MIYIVLYFSDGTSRGRLHFINMYVYIVDGDSANLPDVHLALTLHLLSYLETEGNRNTDSTSVNIKNI